MRNLWLTLVAAMLAGLPQAPVAESEDEGLVPVAVAADQDDWPLTLSAVIGSSDFLIDQAVVTNRSERSVTSITLGVSVSEQGLVGDERAVLFHGSPIRLRLGPRERARVVARLLRPEDAERLRRQWASVQAIVGVLEVSYSDETRWRFVHWPSIQANPRFDGPAVSVAIGQARSGAHGCVDTAGTSYSDGAIVPLKSASGYALCKAGAWQPINAEDGRPD